MSKKPIKTSDPDNPFTKAKVGGKKGYAPKVEKGEPLSVEITFKDGNPRKWKDHEKVRVEKVIAKLIVVL